MRRKSPQLCMKCAYEQGDGMRFWMKASVCEELDWDLP